ncbi:phage tail assembly chaperone G [Bacillus cereus]
MVLNLPAGKKTFFLPQHTFHLLTDLKQLNGQKKLNVENVRFDVLKEATHFVVKVFGNRFTVEEFLEGKCTFGF